MSRSRFIAVGVAFLVAFLLVSTQYSSRRSSEVAQLEAQQADLETELLLKQRSLQRAEEFVAGGEQSEAELRMALAAFPPDADLGGFVTTNAVAAGQAGVEVLAVVPEAGSQDSDDESSDTLRIPLSVTVRGPDEAVAAYIRALGELPRLTVIDDVQLTAEGAGVSSAALAIAVFSQ